MSKKVVFCTPALERPTDPYLDAMEKSIHHVIAAGWDERSVYEIGNPYISAARSAMLRKAMDLEPDVVVFIDYDLSWGEKDLLKLIETPGDVVGGTYRFKTDKVEYMGTVYCGQNDRPLVREDGCIKADKLPAGFLKITREGLETFARAHPHLLYGSVFRPSLDLFNHGVHEGVWWGEDYAFCRNWQACGGDVWLIPDLDLTHHSKTTAYPGNFHEHLLRQPGGVKHLETNDGSHLSVA